MYYSQSLGVNWHALAQIAEVLSVLHLLRVNIELVLDGVGQWSKVDAARSLAISKGRQRLEPEGK